MDQIKNVFSKAWTGIREFLLEPLTIYSLIVAISVSVFIVLEVIYPDFVAWTSRQGITWFQVHYPVFTTSDDRLFSQGFVEWFGVFYGFLLPLLLVRAWEQLDEADREFDREADAIKVLLEDILLLDNRFLALKRDMVAELQRYIKHVFKSYTIEHFETHTELRLEGNRILQGIRKHYKALIQGGEGKGTSLLEPVASELLDRLNDAIDTRGDRISIFGERLFQSLRLVAVVTSVIWLIPFYFLDFQSGLYGSILKLAVTFMIIFVLSIIHDLDEPFSGPWKVSMNSWIEVEKETNDAMDELKDQNVEPPMVMQETGTRNQPEPGKPKTDSLVLANFFLAGSLSLISLWLVFSKRDQKK